MQHFEEEKPRDADAPSQFPLRGEIFDADSIVHAEQNAPDDGKKWGAGWFVAGLALLFCVYSLGAYVGEKSKKPAPVSVSAIQTKAAAPLRVHIIGRVKKPGVYTLPHGARLQDAIQKAGGALPGADVNALNLADWAADGSKIEVPAKVSAKIQPTPTPVVIVKEVVKEVFITAPQNAPGSLARPDKPAKTATASAGTTATRTISKAAASDGIPRAATKSGGESANASLEFLKKNPLDLNRAGATQLEILPGVGPKMAERILAYRKENGGFKSVDDLDNVRGIGEKRMETLRPLVRVN